MNLNVYFIAFVLSISCLVHATSTPIQKKRISHQMKEKRASDLLKRKKGPTEVHDIVDEVVNQLGSYDTLQSDPSQEQPIPQVRKKVFKSSKKNQIVLKDKTNTVKDVEVERTNNDDVEEEEEEDDSSRRQFILQLNAKFTELTGRGNYDGLVKFSETMESEVFLKHVGPLTVSIRNPQTYNMVVYFFVHGNMDIVKKVITGDVFLNTDFREINDNTLTDAIAIALRIDHYERAIDLFVSRAILATEIDERPGLGDLMDFESFVIPFFGSLPGMVLLSLKRLLTNYGEELENRYPGILETICQGLVNNLRWHLNTPSRANLMTDLVAQTTLLTPSAYVNGFLPVIEESNMECLYNDFIKYGWKEVIEMGLNDKWLGCKSERLWIAIRRKFPEHGICSYPPTPDAITAALKLFPTRKQLQEEWVEKDVPGFLMKVNEAALEFVPVVIVGIIIEYVMPTWLDIEHPMPNADDDRIRNQMLYESYADLEDPDID